jgi:glucose-6-phosphate 1-dehydrogenase
LDGFAHKGVPVDLWEDFSSRLFYISQSAGPDALAKTVGVLEDEIGGDCARLHYLSVPPTAAPEVLELLGEAGLGERSRIIMEKPFGTDLESAIALNDTLHAAFDESQIFRIDHFLGKEAALNILAFRFANGLFEPIWNRAHIDHVQIDVPETLSIGHRIAFYEETGAYRDMVVNHLFQVLAFMAMEPPTALAPQAISEEKNKVFRSLRPIEPSHVVRGQYDGYLDEPGVRAHSETETFVALRCEIDNWRWAGVPFYLRTGKALRSKMTEVAINFKQAPFAMFRDTPVDRLARNFLVLGIQPCECISLQFNAKVPGPSIAIAGVKMMFDYQDYFEAAPSTGYETPIYNCMIGDATLFQLAEGVEAGWRVVQPLIDAWRDAGAKDLPTYKAGSEGPEEADQLLARDGRRWRPIA